MNRAQVIDHCLQMPGAVEDYPFGDGVAVFKVAGRMFALVMLGDVPRVNLKCDPSLAIDLRAQYSNVLPGYHQDKKHWNTVMLNESGAQRTNGSITNGSIEADHLRELIEHSYELVVAKLTKSQRLHLGA